MRAEADLAAESSEGILARVLGPEPTPEFAAQMAEECKLLLDKLKGEDLRSIAVWTMEGNTVEEVAAVAVLLASDVAAGITGSAYNVDGGTAAY